MLDRQVLQIQPEQERNESAHPFSSYRATPNLIVLGDPGAGKTELFRQSADATDGHFITVRDFLNTPADVLPRDKWLWIDGLDEARSGRGDKGTIDRLIRKLYEVRPPALRLSCRVADWLGTSDLKALASYFDHQGGAPAVVQLLALTRDEQRQILTAHQRVDPDHFLDEAEHRGLEAMLSNPQTLLMLHLAVQGQAWPATRYELFENATALLLREHNTEHNERDDPATRLPLAMVSDAAGALCALRLISECAGFSLQPDGTKDMPGWREIPLAEPVAIQAALNRRVFVSAGVPHAVDYLHRTVAEYLGAGWIAGKIAAGLPLGRVQALLGVDGKPASSLRGLHAWLAVRSPQSAPVLIDADPMGIVMYADAAQLGPADKRRLLTALSKTAEDDPWFYHGNYAAYGVGSLSDPGMADAFRDLLCAAEAPFALRKLVVDALAMGSPLPALREDLHALLIDARQPFALRDGALDALLAMDDAGRSAVVSAYPLLGEDENGLRLRCIALRGLYGKGLGIEHALAHVKEIANRSEGEYVSALYGLDDVIPDADLLGFLDEIALHLNVPEQLDEDFETWNDIGLFCESLIARAVELDPQTDRIRLYGWLRILEQLPDDTIRPGLLEDAASNAPEIAKAIVEAWIECFDGSDILASGWSSYRRKYGRIISDECIFECFHSALMSGDRSKERFLYRHLLIMCFWNANDFRERFWQLHAYANDRPELAAVRDELCVWSVDEETSRWDDLRKQREKDRVKRRENAMNSFDQQEDEILAGRHLDWLEYIGHIYFSMFSDCNKDQTAEQRLVEYLGERRAGIALAGLRALIELRVAPSLSEVISLRSKGEFYPWWRALLAGLDLLSEEEFQGSDFQDDYLASVIAIELLFPVREEIDGVMRPWRHRWLHILKQGRADLIVRTYAEILEADLVRGKAYPSGLNEISDPALAGPLRDEFVKTLLSRFPLMGESALWELLRLVRDGGSWHGLSAATDAGAAELAEVDARDEAAAQRRGTQRVWLAFGFLSDPERYRSRIEAMVGKDADEMVWALAEVGSLDRHQHTEFSGFSVQQLEFVTSFIAERYPRVSGPSGDMVGRRNPWDASEIVANALNTLSSSTDDAAHAALQRLATNPALVTYASQVRHLLAQQRMRRIDAAHVPPDWRSATQTLLNLSPASAQDLHALVMDHIQSIRQQIAHENTDIYKRFWNEAAHGKVDRPKSENSARNALIELLRPRLQPLGLHVEPEGGMARGKRADIIVLGRDIKCPIELKRDHHPDVWTAAERQLDRFYTPDPQASRYGIYGVFWYGERRGSSIPAPPAGAPRPRSAADMQRHLDDLLPEPLRAKIAIVVIDVSGEIPADRSDRDG